MICRFKHQITSKHYGVVYTVCYQHLVFMNNLFCSLPGYLHPGPTYLHNILDYPVCYQHLASTINHCWGLPGCLHPCPTFLHNSLDVYCRRCWTVEVISLFFWSCKYIEATSRCMQGEELDLTVLYATWKFSVCVRDFGSKSGSRVPIFGA